MPVQGRLLTVLLLGLLLISAANAAFAAPPAYLVLRQHASPGQNHRPGHADAAMYDARTSGYAYGYFGATPRSHASRHFGYYRTYTQWSRW